MKYFFIFITLACPLYSELEKKAFQLGPNFIHSMDSMRFQDRRLFTRRADRMDTGYAEFYLDFEPKNEHLYESPLALLREGYVGKAGYFISKDNTRFFQGKLSPFFSKYPDIGDFTIEFVAMFNSTFGEQILIGRSGYVLDSHNDAILPQGIVFKLHNGKIMVELNHFFHYKNERKSVELVSQDRLRENTWYKIELVYEGSKGLLRLFVSDGLVSQKYVTDTGSSEGKIYYPAFLPENKHPLRLGENQIGKIDELKIFPFAKIGNQKKAHLPVRARFITKVFALGANTYLSKMDLNGEYDMDILQAYVRMDDYYFTEDANLPWTPIPLGKDISHLKKAKYFQVKMDYINYTPSSTHSFQEINITYKVNDLPASPSLAMVQPGANAFTVVWDRNTEEDIAGYSIYYRRIGFDSFFRKIKLENSNSRKKGGDYLDNRVSYTVENIENGHRYEVYIVAWDDADGENESLPSDKKIVTPHLFSQKAN